MRGKLFLLVVVCVSFVQVRGDEQLDKKIEEAIRSLRDILYDLYDKSYNFDYFVKRTFHQYNVRSEENLAEAAKQEVVMYDFLRGMASFVKNEAQTSNQTVLLCIDKVFTTSTQKVRNATKKLRSRLQGENILFNRGGEALLRDCYWLYRVCFWEYDTFAKRFKNCTKVQEVDSLVVHYERLNYVLLKFLQKTDKDVQHLFKTYDEKVEQFLRENREEMESLKTDSVDEMRKCLYPMAATSGRTAFLQFITTH